MPRITENVMIAKNTNETAILRQLTRAPELERRAGIKIISMKTLANWLCASESAHKRRYDAVLETEPGVKSTQHELDGLDALVDHFFPERKRLWTFERHFGEHELFSGLG